MSASSIRFTSTADPARVPRMPIEPCRRACVVVSAGQVWGVAFLARPVFAGAAALAVAAALVGDGFFEAAGPGLAVVARTAVAFLTAAAFAGGVLLAGDTFAGAALLTVAAFAGLASLAFAAGADFVTAAVSVGVGLLIAAAFAGAAFWAGTVSTTGVFFAGVALLVASALADVVCTDGALLVAVAADFAGPAVVRGPAALAAPFLAAFGTFFAPETYALRSVPARNRGTAVALARWRSPLRGFRTIRAGRATFSKEPNPVIVTF